MRRPAVTEPKQGAPTSILERTSQAAFLDTPWGLKVGPDPCTARLLGRPGHDSAWPGQGPGGGGYGEDPVPGCGHPLGRNARHCELLGLQGPVGHPAGGRADVGCPAWSPGAGSTSGDSPLPDLPSGLGHRWWRSRSPAQCCPLLAVISLLHQLDSTSPGRGPLKASGSAGEESHRKVQGCLDGWS